MTKPNMGNPPPPLPAGIREKLTAFGRRGRRVRLLQGVAETLAVFDVAVLLGAMLLWLLRPPLGGRLAVSVAVYGAALAILAWRGLLPLLRRMSPLRIAQRFEHAAGDTLQERLTSAVEFAENRTPGTSPWMAEQTISLAAEEVARFKTDDLVDTRPVVRAWKIAAVAMGLLCVTAVLAPHRVLLVLDPFANPARVEPNSFAVSPGNCRIIAGTTLEIQAVAKIPTGRALLAIRWQDGYREELAMAQPGGTNRFSQTLARIGQGFRYHVRSEEVATPEFTVTVEGPPNLEGIRLAITPPAYTRLPVREVNAGSAELLAGSRVTVSAQIGGTTPRSVEWLPVGMAAQSMKFQTNVASLEIEPATNVTYALRLIGVNGVTNTPPDRWSLCVVPDLPPVVTLAGPGAGLELVGSDEALLVKATATDDVGLSALELLVTSGSNTVRQPLPLAATPPNAEPGQRAEAAATLNLGERKLEVGDEVAVVAEATDLAGNTGRSEPLKLTIASGQAAEAARIARRLRPHLQQVDAAVAALRQARAQMQLFTRSETVGDDDPNADLRLVRQQLGQMREILGVAATNLLAEAGQARHPVAPYIANVGEAAATWAGAQERILNRALDDVAGQSASARADTLARTRVLFEHARDELADLRAQVALAPAALEGETLAAEAELAQGRYKRSLPIARAGEGEDDTLVNGLRVNFYAGRQPTGEPVLKKVDLPRFDNFEVPKVGRENWSALYTGEIQIPESGKWDFAVTANDGVRLTIDGKSLLPADAWADKGAREHKGKADLAAGWRLITIEFFQASGPNQLHVRMSKEGQALTEVPGERLRTRPARAIEHAPIAGLTPAARQAAGVRSAAGLGVAARVAPELSRLAADVPNEQLMRLASEKAGVGPALQADLARVQQWSGPEAVTAEAKGDDLVNAAREANHVLQELLRREGYRLARAADFRAIRLPLEQVRATLEQIKPAEWNRNREDLQARKENELVAATAWSGELTRATEATEQQLFAEARSSRETLAQRAQALQASLRLEREVMRAAEEIEKTFQTATAESRVGEKVEREAQKIENALNELRRVGELERDTQTARLAEAGLRQAAAQNREALAGTVGQIAAAERQRGDLQSAAALEKAAAAPGNPELVGQLRQRVQRGQESAAPLGQVIPPPMHDGVKGLESRPDSQPETVPSLAKARLGLAIEGERLRREGNRKPAVAYARLGRELGDLLQKPETLTAQNLKPLAERATALAGMSGDWAREQAIQKELANASQAALLADEESRVEEAQGEALAGQLEELSQEASQAAWEQPKRSPLMGDLEEMAATPDGGRWEQALASEAAGQASSTIQSAPAEAGSYQRASRTLGEAATSLHLAAASAEAANAESAARSPAAQTADARSTSMPNAGERGPRPREGDFGRNAGTAGGLDGSLSGQDQAAWAKLREKLREAGRAGGLEHFTEEQQEAIRAYFKRLANEK